VDSGVKKGHLSGGESGSVRSEARLVPKLLFNLLNIKFSLNKYKEKVVSNTNENLIQGVTDG
jgi:hypothetical protein